VSVAVEMEPAEQAGYFEVSRAHLYTVLHGAAEPSARVLLVGPFTSERHFSYIPWVRWARYLAARGIECLRFDYRGIGESTGVFEELSFDDWLEDVELLAAWLKRRSPDLPLLLHGLEMGGILAAKAFESGIGDGLLLWSPPANANVAFRGALLRRVAVDHAFKYKDERKPVSDYIRRLENGESLDVDGYEWSDRLWNESLKFELPAAIANQEGGARVFQKPVRMVKLDGRAAPLVKGSAVGYETINRDLSGLLAENLDWIRSAVAQHKRGSREPNH
jgi:hypothetical protein